MTRGPRPVAETLLNVRAGSATLRPSMNAPASPPPRVLVVAENASARFGGEAVLPVHYFRVLRARGIEAWLVAHERTADELRELFPREHDRMRFVPDREAHKLLVRGALAVPKRVADASFTLALSVATALELRSLAREVVREHRVDVVHQPIPVSPKALSLLTDVGAPVVIGPMNGNMSFPPGFRSMDSASTRALTPVLRRGSHALHRLARGKLDAALLLVANERTRAALPRGVDPTRVVELVENGVDLSVFSLPDLGAARAPGPLRALFVGRLVELKALDIAIDAIAALPGATLDVVGDGEMRARWESHAAASGAASRVRFHGWVPQHQTPALFAASDVLVLPSLHECGGAVILEAMALGKPCVAVDWGGPADYIDSETGILVPATDRPRMVVAFRDALSRIDSLDDKGRAMGLAGRAKIEREYDWERKVDRILELYARAMKPRSDRARSSAARPTP